MAASQPGWPLSMPEIMPATACGARFAGVSAKYARLSHSTSHSALATCALTARAAVNGAGVPRPVGHSSTASSA